MGITKIKMAVEIWSDIMCPFCYLGKRKSGLSGEQESSVFLQTLEKAFYVWRENNPEIVPEVLSGQTCTPQGVCE